ncbi:MAG: WecB/TagA/CpsF family glycosyltransferase [Paludibaculum sp.]
MAPISPSTSSPPLNNTTSPSASTEVHPRSSTSSFKTCAAASLNSTLPYAFAPPFRPPTPDEDLETTRQGTGILGARLLFVGIGTPKQDFWMARHRGQIPAVMLGVGAAFDFLAGTKPQAPRWMMSSRPRMALPPRLRTAPPLETLTSEVQSTLRRTFRLTIAWLAEGPAKQLRFPAALRHTSIVHTARPSHAGLPAGPPAAANRPRTGTPPLLDPDSTFARPQVRAPGRVRATWAILLADLVALELSLFFGYSLRIFLLPWFPQEFQPQHYKGLALGVLVIPLVYFLLDLYPGYGMNPAQRLRKRVQATFVVFSLLLAWDFLVQGHQWSRGIVLGTGLFAFVLPALFDEIARHFLSNAGMMGVPVLVLGGGKTGRHIIRIYCREPRPRPPAGRHPRRRPRPRGSPHLWSPGRRYHRRSRPPSSAAPSKPPSLRSPAWTKHSRRSSSSNCPSRTSSSSPTWQGIQSLWVTPRDLGGILGLEVNRNLLHAVQRP